ncbi:hypothetical protein BJ875DRAFT_246411 [Amylocarpus encephaloides]|uniref:Protein EFR3 n=1 Tax=Amylocarpus encephaloides TaxID=45428 RepID=A0A9P8C784_9HELO|nr:hypothetical protein BJ875DRAFT_246411 [Amylocarpus encephaloides]
MHAIRQKCRPKHQVLILKCYPTRTKSAVDVKPNSSELSYLLYYATTRRSKVQKVGAFLEKKTASDVWRARIGNVQVTLQILAGLIEKAPRDLPLYAPSVLKILNIILRSRDITMVESSIPTFEAFCDHHDGASLAADQEYLHQYEEIVQIYASFASTRTPPMKPPATAPVAMRWRNVGLEAIKSVASSDALASVAGRQLDVIIPMLLENIWTDNEDFVDMLEDRAEQEVKTDAEKSLLRRRTSTATVRTVDTSGNPTAAAISATTADADKLAEENIGVLAMQCLQQIFVLPNRAQIHGATTATLDFIADRVAQKESVIDEKPKGDRYGGWATKVFELIAGWTPVQDRYVILVTAMDVLVHSPVVEDRLQEQLVLATMVDSLLKSDINLIGLSVMDVLLSLIHHVVKLLQLSGLQGQQDLKTEKVDTIEHMAPSPLRRELLNRLQGCVGDLATHVYYADQISDMVSALLARLKPSPSSAMAVVSIENPNPTTLSSVSDLLDDTRTDGFFLYGTAKVKALEAIKDILLVASHRKNVIGGASLGRNSVPLRVWEGTQWLLRDTDGRVRKAYVDALSTWLETETTKTDLRAMEEKPKLSPRTAGQNNSVTNLTKRAVSNASQKDKHPKAAKTTFLQLLHLAVYENAVQFVDNESDFVILHLLLANLTKGLGVNAVKSGLPMIYRLQEDILVAETPLAKIRIGSLCHGYFWMLSERFDFDSSPIGKALHNEIHRRRTKMFWVDRIRLPPVPLEHIDTPGTRTPQSAIPVEKVESESLTPFDDRFQMVKLISLSYAESLSPATISPPTSPGRSFSHPVLNTSPSVTENVQMPEKVKDQMMSEWSREAVITLAQEGSKSVSINGSRTGTNATAHRNFLAVNGNLNNSRPNSRTQSPPSSHQAQNTHRAKPDSSYGLLGGLGALRKLRKGSGNSDTPASESSRNSVTRVDQLKRVLSGQVEGPPFTRGGPTHSDASSESMVSYDFTASEVSYNPGQQNLPMMERSVSLREPNGRSRSKSRDRVASQGEHQRPLTSNPTSRTEAKLALDGHEFDRVPPVPPIPSSLAGDATSFRDHGFSDPGKKQVPKARASSYGSGMWGEDKGVVDLESLLSEIDTTVGGKGNAVLNPPY